ncbi:MAG: hypothetical protein MSJ26_08575 [Oscillospiraceae bacterium]|nr:hypothetical protein [Oscillospiraceae bacterium]
MGFLGDFLSEVAKKTAEYYRDSHYVSAHCPNCGKPNGVRFKDNNREIYKEVRCFECGYYYNIYNNKR